jgi:beta-mannosidase
LFELFVGLIILLCLGQAAFAQPVAVSLNQGWEFRQKSDSAARTEGKWHPAEVPGVVYTDLLRHKIIPDPFFRSNEAGLQWIENASWELLLHPRVRKGRQHEYDSPLGRRLLRNR